MGTPALYTSGCQHLFAQLRGQGTPQYLGTCVTAPEQEAEKFKIEVMNDLSGRSVPFQLVQDGEKWLVTAVMNRFSLALVQSILSLESGGSPAAPGSESGVARGTLVIGISDFQLFVVNAYAGTTAQGATGTPGVIPLDLFNSRGFATCNVRKYRESTAGTRVLEVAMAIECQNVFNPATLGFTCYTLGGTGQSPLLQQVA